MTADDQRGEPPVKTLDTKKKTWTPPKAHRIDYGMAEAGDSILGDSSLAS